MESWDSSSIQLIAELKKMFPKIQEGTIIDCVNQNSKDREECIKFLTRIKEDYLFGCQSPISILTVREKFSTISVNDDITENNENDSKEILKSEDIYIPQETVNFKYSLMDEEKNRGYVKQTSKEDTLASAKDAVQSAPVIPGVSCPYRLLNNGNFAASGQRDLSSNTTIGNLNNVLPRDTSKWNNNGNTLAAQLSRQNILSRYYSYPIPDPQTAHLPNIPMPTYPSVFNYNHLNSEDYAKPLHISETPPQFLTPPYVSPHPSISLLPPSSPNSQRQHSPIPRHLVPPYTSSPSSVLESPSISSHLAAPYSSPLPAVPHITPFPYPSPIRPPHQYASTSHSSTSATTTGLHYAYEPAFPEDQLRERMDKRRASLHANPFQQTYELFPRDFAPRTFSPNLPMPFDQYNSQFTDQVSAFMPNASQAKAEGNKDTDYVTALVQHQSNSYQLIMNELLRMRNLRYTLRKDVSFREEELLQIKQHKKFPNMEQIQKLKEEIIKLRVERDCLMMKLDFHIRGQESSNAIENFYENIFTGPKGPIPPAPNNTTAQNENNYIDCRDEDDQSDKWHCNKCTYANHPDLIHCEICESPRVMIN